MDIMEKEDSLEEKHSLEREHSLEEKHFQEEHPLGGEHSRKKKHSIEEKHFRKEKSEIRRRVLALRDGLSDEERKKASLILTERIVGHQWFYRSEYVLSFVSYGSEISTVEIMEEALRAGKKLYVPKVIQGQACRMAFYRIRSLEELKEGYRGIPEPSGDSEEYMYSDTAAEHTLMLMPGAAFDRYRTRLGYGKGFYDRYLADKALLQLRTIAVGYKCQLVEMLPWEDTDIKPYQVICV